MASQKMTIPGGAGEGDNNFFNVVKPDSKHNWSIEDDVVLFKVITSKANLTDIWFFIFLALRPFFNLKTVKSL